MNQFIFLVWFALLSCQPSAGSSDTKALKGTESLRHLGYNSFQLFELPNYLVEISGLSYVNDSTLLCHNDEEGEFYHFNLNTGKITNKTRFGSDDDYEGIANNNDHIYIVRSSGHITTYSVAQQKTTNVQNTALNTANNVEGLDIDSLGNLWIACKGKAGKEFKKSDRAIYTLDSAQLQLAFLINENELENTFGEKKVSFKPSGIALHPNGEQVYISSAFESRLLITSKNGDYEQYLKINQKLLPQLEGIAIAPNGTLYLASEGKGKKGRILVCSKAASSS